MSKPVCPYIAGRPVSEASLFFGREDIFEFVANVLRIPHENVVVLSGQRRIGKTSILLQLQRRLPNENCLPVCLDLMDKAQKSLGAVLFELSEAMARRVGETVDDPRKFDDEGNYFCNDFLPAFYRFLPANRRPVLMFDEFDVLAEASGEAPDSNKTAKVFFPYLRRLMDQHPRLAFVFVIGRNPQDLSIDIVSLWKTGHHKRVSVLEENDTRALITLAERQGTLRFLQEAVTAIWKLSGGHPLFTQLLCQIVWDKAHPVESSREEAPLVDLNTVTTAANELVAGHGQAIFHWIWDGLPAAEKIVLAVMAEARTNKLVASPAEILPLLQKNGIRLLTRELEAAPRNLVDWDLLHKTPNGYVFPVELLRRWIVHNKPIGLLKDEVESNDPLSKGLYETAEELYRRRSSDTDLDLALRQLRRVRNINPNHIKSRLRIAQILQEQNNLQAALDELWQAYRYDAEETRYSLFRVLVLRAEEMERNAEDPQDILPFYQQALDLVPHEQNVREQMIALSKKQEAAGRLGTRSAAWGPNNPAAIYDFPIGSSSEPAPTPFVLRKILGALFLTDADFDAFCLDHCAAVHSRFSMGMDRVSKTNLLLQLIAPSNILDMLHQDSRDNHAKLDLIRRHLNEVESPEKLRAAELGHTLKLLSIERSKRRRAGQDTADLDVQIVTVKREQRQFAQLHVGELLSDRYELMEVIGRGGFARIWQAYDQHVEQLVAVKILHAEASDEPRRMQRFVRGAQQMKNLQHPNIARVLDGPSVHRGFNYFVMDYFSGGDLSKAVITGVVNRKGALRLLMDIGAALSHAHANRLIHRDVKPQNILIDGLGKAHLTDFDLVWAADTTGGTRTGFLGTHIYSAPEQQRDAKSVDERADVYSLAMTTIFVLYGDTLPPEALYQRGLFVDELRCERSIKKLLHQAIAIDREDRPQSISDFCRVLSQALADSSETWTNRMMS